MAFRFRVAAALAAVGLLAATTAPAAGAEEEVDDLYAGANAVTATLSVLGTPLGSFGGTEAIAEALPLVDVGSFGFRGANGNAAVGVTEAVADTVGALVKDPAVGDKDCGAPEVGALPAVGDVITVLDVCSASQAALPDLLDPRALGAAQAGGITLNGTALADVVLDLLLDPILTQLQGAVVQVQGALEPVEGALSAICDELPAEISPAGVAEQANALGLPVLDIIEALPSGDRIVETLQSDCLLSLDTLVDVVAVVPAITEDLVRDTILAALDTDLLAISLGSTSSSILDDAEALVARSELQALEISTLSLQSVVDAVNGLVAGQVQGLLDQVLAGLPAELGALTDQIPTLDSLVGQVLAPLDGLVDDEPLLSIQVSDSLADARTVVGSDEVDTSRSQAGGVTVSISPAIASLLRIPADYDIAPGERLVIGEGTPLESVVSVGAVEQLTETLGASQVRTAGARVTGSEIRLLTGLPQGGIVAATGATEARVGGSTVAAVPDTPAAPEAPTQSLPRTGSSDDLTLLAGMGALALLGGAVHLRRRFTATD